jgi:predicted transposase/invertase (TIGR01784 family)
MGVEISEIEKARLRYLSRLIADMDYVTAMAGAKEVGREEGRAEGKAEGRAEVALDMIKDGYKDDEVMKITGFDSDTVKDIRAEWELEKANPPSG